MTGKPTKNCNTLYSVEYIPMGRKEAKRSFADGHKAKIFTGIMCLDQYEVFIMSITKLVKQLILNSTLTT